MLVELASQIASYATLLNCWKFLRACLYQIEQSMACDFVVQTNEQGMVIIKQDATMDNQQPMPNLLSRVRCLFTD
jgi:hypothetical protein